VNIGKGRESAVRISLLDVMYGVVLAYGFGFFDQASMTIDYFRFFFAYAVLIVDWIYVHSLYWGWEYKYNSFLILDIGILFTMSRLLNTSITGQSPCYWLWMSALFAIYVTWDIVSKRKGLPSEYDWRYSIGGDLFGAIAFLVFYILLLKGKFQPTSIPLIVGTIVVYIIAVRAWFRKLPHPRSAT
jgi:hypothetical protein